MVDQNIAANSPRSEAMGEIENSRAEQLKKRYAALERMKDLRKEAIKEGMTLLSFEEINSDLSHRRGEAAD